ncbi:hydroxyacylglutathione hydrolase [Methylophilaceae bacterium]|nr:hydroxyacylglutathione hydrolase [Methylophilaceae bacterium]|tara:strand:- start:5013 stop:5741 length:729 start_codon:yes stop_codon:yes gene_type:complete
MHSLLTQNNNINIIPIKAFKDNYIWLIQEKLNGIIVDPGDAKPVLTKLEKEKINLKAILITHKHHDHIGGIEELINNYPNVKIYGPENNQFGFKYQIVKEGDAITVSGTKVKFNIIETPGHTLDHIVYVDKEHLFCGDTLFACGCGKLFEGTHDEMYKSLLKISSLAPNTKVYCGHEYTKENIKFALSMDADNYELNERFRRLQDVEITIPSLLQEELETNPFLRVRNSEEFKLIRKRKDEF